MKQDDYQAEISIILQNFFFFFFNKCVKSKIYIFIFAISLVKVNILINMSEFYFCDKLSKDHFKKVINTIQVLKEKNSIESLQKDFSDCCESDGDDANIRLTSSEKSETRNSTFAQQNETKNEKRNNNTKQKQSNCCSQQYQSQSTNSKLQNNCCCGVQSQKSCPPQQNYQSTNMINTNIGSRCQPGSYYTRVPVQPAPVYQYAPSPTYQQVTFVPVHQNYSPNLVNPPNQYYSPMAVTTNTPMSITLSTPMTISSNTPTNTYPQPQPKSTRPNVHYHNPGTSCDCNKLILPRK